MSNHHHHHYHQPTIQADETEVDLVKVNEPATNDEPVAKVEEAVIPVATGKVTDCDKLNVRRAPSLNATVVCQIARNADVTIDEDKSNAEWYSVCTEAGVNGFCMKKYITISQ